MKDFNDLQNLWNEQPSVQIPDVNTILAGAKKTQQDLNKKISVQIGILVAVVIFILFLVTVIPFKQATTFIGIGLMTTTILAFSSVRLYQVFQMKKMDLTQNPRQLLLDLEWYYQFQNKVNTRYTQVYFLLMNLAFAFYFIEVLQPVSLLYKILLICVYLVWMIFAFFYLGKKHKNKEQAKIQSIIDAVKLVEREYDA